MRKLRKKPIKIRRRWAINPATRVKKSKKVYSRKRKKRKGINHEA